MGFQTKMFYANQNSHMNNNNITMKLLIIERVNELQI